MKARKLCELKQEQAPFMNIAVAPKAQVLSVEDVPLGIQIMGFEGEDADLAAIGRALLTAFGSQTVGPG